MLRASPRPPQQGPEGGSPQEPLPRTGSRRPRPVPQQDTAKPGREPAEAEPGAFSPAAPLTGGHRAEAYRRLSKTRAPRLLRPPTPHWRLTPPQPRLRRRKAGLPPRDALLLAASPRRPLLLVPRGSQPAPDWLSSPPHPRLLAGGGANVRRGLFPWPGGARGLHVGNST